MVIVPVSINYKAVENIMKNASPPHYLSPRFWFLAITVTLLICAMVYSYLSSKEMIIRYYPLVDATMEIKYEATRAHLWLEEILAGDKDENIDDIYHSIERAKSVATTMLEGSSNQDDTLEPLKDNKIRGEISVIIEKLVKLKAITEQRNKTIKLAGAGSHIDQNYDKLFHDLILQINLVETMLQQKITGVFSTYKKVQTIIIILSCIFVIIAMSFLKRYEREQTKNIELTNKSLDRFKLVMDSIDALVYVADMQTYEILFINKYGRKLFTDITGKICWQTLQSGQDGPCSFCTNYLLINQDGTPAPPHVWEIQNSVTKRWFHLVDRAIFWDNDKLVRLEVASDITDRKNEEIVKEALIDKLEKALDEIQTLQGILPICSVCKNIRNDDGYYEQIEEYFHKHSGVDFSHTICPTCVKKEYPDLYNQESQDDQNENLP